MKFRTETIEEFNAYCDTSLTEDMTFSQVGDNIEEATNNYFYISMCGDDVIEAYLSEEDVASQLGLDFIFIEEVGVYIALQP